MYRMSVYPRKLHSTENAPVKEAHLYGVVEWRVLKKKVRPLSRNPSKRALCNQLA